MNLETISRKQLIELEQCVQELLSLMRKTKVGDDSLRESLKSLEQKLGDDRRRRFDEANPEYKGY